MAKKTCASWTLLLLMVGLITITASQARAQGESQLFLPLVASAPAPIPFGSLHSGEGTYYAATGAGNCGFPATPDNLMVAALNLTDYANAALCGAYIRVQGPNGVVDVRVVDSCPPCAPGDVDLSLEAFAHIAYPVAGRVPITWQLLSYPLDGPIVYHFKDGSNHWWTAVQIRNHRNPIVSVEWLDGGGIYRQISRTSYNYFVALSGLGPGPYTFRVTDIFGNNLVDSNIPLLDDADFTGSGQFPPP